MDERFVLDYLSTQLHPDHNVRRAGKRWAAAATEVAAARALLDACQAALDAAGIRLAEARRRARRRRP